nr:MAG TPA: hypothetical protein [Caudoviricetes sp.]
MTKYIYYKDSKYTYMIFVIFIFYSNKKLLLYFYSNSLYYFK